MWHSHRPSVEYSLSNRNCPILTNTYICDAVYVNLEYVWILYCIESKECLGSE